MKGPPDPLSAGQLIRLHDFYVGQVDLQNRNQLVMDTISALAELIDRRGREPSVTLTQEEAALALGQIDLTETDPRIVALRSRIAGALE